MNAFSWISARGGKWHVSRNAEPSWTRDEASACGLTFRPLNVMHGERPPTLRRHVCAHCLAQHPQAWPTETGVTPC